MKMQEIVATIVSKIIGADVDDKDTDESSNEKKQIVRIQIQLRWIYQRHPMIAKLSSSIASCSICFH